MQNEAHINFSFDDGWALDMRIADMLEYYGFYATFYIIVDRVGQENCLTWDQIKELDRRGFTIGSHTVTHPMDMKALYDEELYYEVKNSKEMLETVLGRTVTKFCYPRGRYDERVLAAVEEAGYISARAVGKPGVLEIKNQFEIPGTIHIYQRQEYNGVPILEYAKQIIDKVRAQGGFCEIWGHSREIDQNNLWGVLEDVLKYVKEGEKN